MGATEQKLLVHDLLFRGRRYMDFSPTLVPGQFKILSIMSRLPQPVRIRMIRTAARRYRHRDRDGNSFTARNWRYIVLSSSGPIATW